MHKKKRRQAPVVDVVGTLMLCSLLILQDDSPPEGPDIYYLLVGFPQTIAEATLLFARGIILDAVVTLSLIPKPHVAEPPKVKPKPQTAKPKKGVLLLNLPYVKNTYSKHGGKLTRLLKILKCLLLYQFLRQIPWLFLYSRNLCKTFELLLKH